MDNIFEVPPGGYVVMEVFMCGGPSKRQYPALPEVPMDVTGYVSATIYDIQNRPIQKLVKDGLGWAIDNSPVDIFEVPTWGYVMIEPIMFGGGPVKKERREQVPSSPVPDALYAATIYDFYNQPVRRLVRDHNNQWALEQNYA